MAARIAVFFVFCFMASNLHAVYVSLSSNITREGSIISVSISSPGLLKSAEIMFLDKKYPVFFERYDRIEKECRYSALVPVPLDVSGRKNLTVRWLGAAGEGEQAEVITVKKMKRDESRIRTGGQVNEASLEELGKENKMISAFQDKITAARREYNFIVPAEGVVSGRFGTARMYDSGSVGWRHKGIDIANKAGTPVKACGKGSVATASATNRHGNTIIIDHGGGVFSLYFHMDRLYVRKGRTVAAGDVIGTMGSTGISTGPHLHWQVNVFKTPVNPMDFVR